MSFHRGFILRSTLAGLALLGTDPARSTDVTQPNAAVEHGDLRLDIDSRSTLERADDWTSFTLRRIEASPHYTGLLADARATLTQRGRVGELSVSGEWIFEYLQTASNPLGVWRRSSRAAYSRGAPRWSVLIDLDRLSAREGRKMFFGGAACRDDRCLVALTENGRDAAETREFDLGSAKFVPDGFHIPASKSRVWWYDRDTLVIAPAIADADRNRHGMARRLKLWRRGTPLASARQMFTLEPKDASVSAMLIGAGDLGGFVAVRHMDFIRRAYQLIGLDGSRRLLPLPENAQILGGDAERLLIRLDEASSVSDRQFSSGTVVSVPIRPLLRDAALRDVSLIYAPEKGEAVVSAAAGAGSIILTTLHNYKSEFVEVTEATGRWTARRLGSPAPLAEILSRSGRELLIRTEGPLQPEAILSWNLDSGAKRTIAQRPPAFDAANMESTLLQTASRDGTPIDYLVISKRGISADGTNPTLVYGYGGFDVPVTQRYEPLFGKLWLERGGVYVHAYLRGGGEHGPDWHLGALRENHPLAFEDLEAVLRDLHDRRITAPAHTGIIGRSNGGLLTASVMQRSPELINAAVIGGPLIDMLNYHQLPPGGTWTSEYGDPDIPVERAILSRYSPMQNIASSETRYPVPLIITSRDDDRVLPGHARRFSDLLSRKGHENFYFEDLQGGHYWELAGGPAAGDWRLRATARAVEFTYLWDRLGRDGALGIGRVGRAVDRLGPQ